MADTRGVWGIDIGQAGLKAIRLRFAEAAGQAIAVNFDYVPHPKILSQPDAIPEELIPQALETFLSRNDISGDAVSISVPGQTALARFIQLPPVEAGKVAEIVKYEARQQIPFALEDVIWDFQTLGGGSEEGGFMLEAEVGLFAMKREQVMQQLKPFTDKKLEVELIQIAPLALFNVLSYDQLGIRAGEKSGDDEGGGPAAPTDEYIILLDMGADNTTLLVSNGEKIWIRNVPIGGNHFTRALTKEMKLTFAKAEHLKCNATRSPDPRAVFQALRPVFNDYVSEIQRSIGYFSSVNRSAKIKKVIGVGNGFKLAGLQKFLQQNLQYEVVRLDKYNALVGDNVLNAPLFQENVLSFAVPYGLALQGLELTHIKTTLLPPEIRTARVIRRKKPWAVTAAAVLLFMLMLSGVLTANVQKSVSEERFGDNDPNGAVKQVETHNSAVSSLNTKYESTKNVNSQIKQGQSKLLMPLETRFNWLEVYKALSEVLPRDQGGEQDETDVQKRERVMVRLITQKKETDLAAWYESLFRNSKDMVLKRDQASPPTGEGYVFTLECEHYHHDPDSVEDPKERYKEMGRGYVEDRVIDQLEEWEVNGVPVRAIGISHATIAWNDDEIINYDPSFKYSKGARAGMLAQLGGGYGGYGDDESNYEAPADVEEMAPDNEFTGPEYGDYSGGGGPGMAGIAGFVGARFDPTKLLQEPGKKPEYKTIHRYPFRIQFVWKPMSSLERAKFAVMHDLLVQTPQDQRNSLDLARMNEHITKFEELNIDPRHKDRLRRAQRDITQAEFDDFIRRHTDRNVPAADQTAAAK